MRAGATTTLRPISYCGLYNRIPRECLILRHKRHLRWLRISYVNEQNISAKAGCSRRGTCGGAHDDCSAQPIQAELLPEDPAH
jgi:hypothetical protein